MTTIPLISTIPTDPPSTADPATFDTRADAFLGDFPDFATELNAAATAMNTVAGEVNTAAADIAAAALAAADAAGYVGTSTSTIAVSAGAKSVTLSSAKDNFAVNDRVILVSRADPSIKLVGTITTKTSSTVYAVTVTSSGVFGSGSYSSWLMIHGGFFASGATAAEMWAGTSEAAPVTPEALSDAAAFQALTEAATIAWNTATQGFNAKITLTADRAMGAPTNLKDGWTYTLMMTQDGTGGWEITSWDAVFDWGAAGAPILSTGAGKVDFAFGIYSSDTGKLHMNFRKAAA